MYYTKKGFRILFLGKLDIFIQESNYMVLMRPSV